MMLDLQRLLNLKFMNLNYPFARNTINFPVLALRVFLAFPMMLFVIGQQSASSTHVNEKYLAHHGSLHQPTCVNLHANDQNYSVDSIQLIYIALESESLVEFITTNYPNRSRGITPPKRVRCVETGRVYNSYAEAAKDNYVTRSGIYKAVRKGQKANGYHFELVDK